MVRQRDRVKGDVGPRDGDASRAYARRANVHQCRALEALVDPMAALRAVAEHVFVTSHSWTFEWAVTHIKMSANGVAPANDTSGRIVGPVVGAVAASVGAAGNETHGGVWTGCTKGARAASEGLRLHGRRRSAWRQKAVRLAEVHERPPRVERRNGINRGGSHGR